MSQANLPLTSTLARHWCFTQHLTILDDWELTDDDYAPPHSPGVAHLFNLPSIDHLRYGVWQLEECPTTGRHHLQGYLEFSRPKRMRAVLNCFRTDWDLEERPLLQPPHVEPRHGSRAAARDYCMKPQGQLAEPMEFGDWLTGGQGTRADLSIVRDKVLSGVSLQQIDLDFPEQAARFQPYLLRLRQVYVQSVQVPPPISTLPWQDQLLVTLSEKPHPRKILWYWSSEGRTGKSTTTRLIETRFGYLKVQVFLGGKIADVGFALDQDREIFIFDMCRDSFEFLNYGLLEQIKNGRIWSPKYQSTSKLLTCGHPHVLVFANQEPDKSKLSDDRWEVHRLYEQLVLADVIETVNTT